MFNNQQAPAQRGPGCVQVTKYTRSLPTDQGLYQLCYYILLNIMRGLTITKFLYTERLIWTVKLLRRKQLGSYCPMITDFYNTMSCSLIRIIVRSLRTCVLQVAGLVKFFSVEHAVYLYTRKCLIDIVLSSG